MHTFQTSDIIDRPENVLIIREFFAGLASGDYYNGMSYQLYLDLDTGDLFISQQASHSTWLQRADGSLVMVLRVSGYLDTPSADRYDSDTDDLEDFGYGDWVTYELTDAIDRVLDSSLDSIF